MTLTAVLRRMGCGDITAHGFRSTFRDWCSERTSYPRDVAEMALAHTIGDKVEAAYRRGDLFEKRRLMMREWGKFSMQIQAPADVTQIRRKSVN
jgi:integrase